MKLPLSVVAGLHIFCAFCSLGQPFLTNGLVAYYPLNGDANDASGNGLNGTPSANSWFVEDRFGNANGAIFITNDISMAELDTGRIDIPLSTIDALTSGTISAWINPDAVDSGDIVAKQHAGANSYAIFSIGGYSSSGGLPALGNPGTLYFRASNSSPLASSTAVVSTQSWQHVMVAFSSSNCLFFINGKLSGTNAGNYTIPGDLSANTESIGSWYYDGGWGSLVPLRYFGSIDDVRIYNRAFSPSDASHLYGIESGNTNLAWPATATAVVVSNFLVGVDVTDSGYGYTNMPLVRVIGGGGNGAQAVAVVNNGAVIAVNVLNAGNGGYTNAPVIVIDPPFLAQPTMNIVPASLLRFTNTLVGTNYQLQLFQSGVWINQGSTFTASSNTYALFLAGIILPSKYRLAAIPIPLQASATAQRVNGFVVGATVTAHGTGYLTNPGPMISITGGGGGGAGAVANISGGTVASLTITNAGSGYTSTPIIQIAPPPVNALFPTVTSVLRIDLDLVSPYDNYQIESQSSLKNAWSNFGEAFTSSTSTSAQYIQSTNAAGFFRVRHVP